MLTTNLYKKLITLTLLIGGLLSGCATRIPFSQNIPTHPFFNFTTQGVINLSYDKQHTVAHLFWQQEKKTYHLVVSPPLSMLGSIQLIGKPGQVTLYQPNRPPMKSTSAKQLIKQELGWTFPVKSLKYWIQGLPIPNSPSTISTNPRYRQYIISQQGWRIYLSNYKLFNGYQLPTHIELMHPHIHIKLVLRSWRV